MAVPILKLDLAPPSNLWRTNHIAIGWAALALGAAVLAGSIGFTWRAYRLAADNGKLAGSLSGKTRATADAQGRIMADLRSVDVAKELPRWRLAERIYTERSLPWSRLTSELERSLVQDVRIKSLQRNRSTDMKVQLKLKGEARSREAEADFVEALQKNAFFEQVILEREGERQGGGVDFDYTLAVSSNPPPYQPLPKTTPRPKRAAAQPVPAKVPARAPVIPPRGVQPVPGGIAVPPARVPAAGPARPIPYPGAPQGQPQPQPPFPSRRSHPPNRPLPIQPDSGNPATPGGAQ
jgi:hypothetical protein